MRYAVLAFAIAMFVIWESVYSDWLVTRSVLDEINRLRLLLMR